MSNSTPEYIKILHTSGDLLLGDRLVDHGPPLENHQRIADYWNIKLASKLNGNRITASDVAIMMLLLKVARTEHSPVEDTFVDMASYAALAGAFVGSEKPAEDPDVTGVVVAIPTEDPTDVSSVFRQTNGKVDNG